MLAKGLTNVFSTNTYNKFSKTRVKTLNPRILLLYLFVAALPFIHHAPFTIAQRGVHYDWLLSAGLIFIVIVQILVGKRKVKINCIGYTILLFNCAAILSFLNLLDADRSQIVDFATVELQILLVTSLFFAISNLQIRWHQVRQLLKMWVLIAFIASVYGIYQVFAIKFALPLLALPTMIKGLPFGMSGTYPRPSSFLMEPSYFAGYLIPPILSKF